MLQRAIDIDPDLNKIELVEYMIRIGQHHLLVWEDPEKQVITGAVTVAFLDHSTERVASINLMGGNGVVNESVFSMLKQYMRDMGATVAQCICKGNIVRLYEKQLGMENTHQVMRLKL
jgi:hypothetical protein